MTTKIIRQSAVFRATPHAVYEALMDTKQHGKLTGGRVKMSRNVGGSFSIFDGGLSGTNLELVPDKKIVQAWRCEMKGWPKGHYSKATFEIKKIKAGTKLTFIHTGVPSACAKDIAHGWHNYYWKPMKEVLD